MKALIFDSSTLISFAMNGLYDEIRKLKEAFGGKFIITREVKWEIIDRPLKIKRFELEALRLKGLLDAGVLEMPSSLKAGIDEDLITSQTKEILQRVNSAFFGGGRYIHLIDLGETSALALGEMLNDKGIENALAIDERTTRLLIEKPSNLQELFEKKLHVKIEVDKEKLKGFTDLKVVRSPELAYILWKKKLMKIGNGQLLDALLYALKFKGCAISDDEIRAIKKFG